MKQQAFEALHAEFWRQFDAALTDIEKKRQPTAAPFLDHYRTVCAHLALAQTRHYSGSLNAYLQDLAARGQRLVYRNQSLGLAGLMEFVRYRLPQTVRREKAVILAAHLLFYGPLLFFWALAYGQPDWAQKLAPAGMIEGSVHNFHEMSQQYAQGVNRDWENNILMFGFYIFNNIGIAFQCFAGGLLFGVGSVYVLLTNGFSIGVLMGYISTTPERAAFFSFVGAHGAFELTAIVLAGAAGLRIGLSLVQPQGHRRLTALRLQGKTAATLLGGAFAMLTIAAALEAFWSPLTSIPMAFKGAIAVGLWIWMYAYLLLSGREHESL